MLHSMNHMQIALRTPDAADRDFLGMLFTSAVPGREYLPAPLLQLQYEAHGAQLLSCWGLGGDCVVEVGGRAAGRLWVTLSPGGFHLADISLLPEFRGHGIGRKLLLSLCDAADHAGHPINLSVAMDNIAAIELYQRFGFVPTSKHDGVYQSMVRTHR